jgi:hypothetical protein
MNHELGRCVLALVVGLGQLAAGSTLAATGPDAALPTGTLEVRVRDGRLEMVFGPKRFVGVLQPYSGNTFQMEWPGWKAQVSTVTFTVPAGHAAEKMTVSLFEDVRGGEFVRVAVSAP